MSTNKHKVMKQQDNKTKNGGLCKRVLEVQWQPNNEAMGQRNEVAKQGDEAMRQYYETTK